MLVTNTYDDLGNLTSVKDGRGAVTAFRYDGQKRLTTWDPGKPAESWEKSVYNSMLLTDRITDNELPGTVEKHTGYFYDSFRRLEKIVYDGAPGVDASAHPDNQTRTYDLADRLRSVSYPNETGSVRNVGTVPDMLDRVKSTPTTWPETA